MCQSKIYFEGDKVLLRILRCSDLWDVYKNIRGGNVNKWVGYDSHTGTNSKFYQWMCRVARHTKKTLQLVWQIPFRPKIQTVFRFGIVLKETQKVVGVLTLTRDALTPQSGEIGFWIGEKYWGRGLMTDALKLALEFGFTSLALEEITAWTFEKNVGSKKVLEKCGFRLDSIIRAAYFKYNEMQNRLNYKILRSEYKTHS